MRVVSVLGMHRSGTSAITRGLVALGVDLGDNLLEPYAYNPKGLFEDKEISALNDEVLARLGSSWHALASIDEHVLTGRTLAGERQRAITLLRSRVEETKIFGFKDPRMSILAPFWEPVFEELGLDPSFVIAVRNPLEVAASLSHRDGTSRIKGLLLWLKYMLAATRHSAGRPRVFVSYERLLGDPKTQLGRIATGLDLPMPADSSREFADYSKEFLTTALRHRRWTSRSVEQSREVPAAVKKAYAVLEKLAAAIPGERALDTRSLAPSQAWLETFDQVLDQLDQYDRMLGEAWGGLKAERDRHAVEIKNAQEATNATAAEAEKRVLEESARARTLAEQLELEREAHIAEQAKTTELAAIASIRAQAVAELETALASEKAQRQAEREAALVRSSAALETILRLEDQLKAAPLRAELDALTLRLAEATHGREMDAARALIEKKYLTAQLEWMQSELAKRTERPAPAHLDPEPRESGEPTEKPDLSRAFDEAARMIDDLKAELALRQAMHDARMLEQARMQKETEATLADARATIQALQGSTSWRVTAPLRGISLALVPRHGNSPAAQVNGRGIGAVSAPAEGRSDAMARWWWKRMTGQGSSRKH